MKNRKTYGGIGDNGPFGKQHKARTGNAFGISPLPRPAAPKPETKPSFQEVMYPKANMPAQTLPAAQPSKPEPKLSFQESLHPKATMPAPPQRAAQPPKLETKASFQEVIYPKQKPVKDTALSPAIPAAPASTAAPKATSPLPPTPAKPAKEDNKIDPMRKHDPIFDSQQLRAEQRRMLTDPAAPKWDDQSGADEPPEPPMNRLKSAACEFGQGFVSTIATLPKGFGVAEKQSALQMLDIYHQYENGNADTGPISASRSKTYNTYKFRNADETERNKILRGLELTALAPVTDIPAYRAGEDMQDWVTRVFPTEEAYAGELTQRLARGGGAAAAMALMGVITRGAGLGVTAGTAATGAIVGSVEGFDDALVSRACMPSATALTS